MPIFTAEINVFIAWFKKQFWFESSSLWDHSEGAVIFHNFWFCYRYKLCITKGITWSQLYQRRLTSLNTLDACWLRESCGTCQLKLATACLPRWPPLPKVTALSVIFNFILLKAVNLYFYCFVSESQSLHTMDIINKTNKNSFHSKR